MSMEFQQYLDSAQLQSPLIRFDQAPVLYSLDGIDPFLQRIKESIIDKPQSRTTLFITGESGAGKEMIAGQFIHELLESNPDIEIGFISLGMAMKAAKNIELASKYKVKQVTRDGFDYDESDYKSASQMMDALIEDFYTSPSGKPKLVIVETVGHTYPTFDHGSSTIRNQMDKIKEDEINRNVFLLGLIADDKVQEEAFRSRNAAGQNASPEHMNSLLNKQGIRRDVLFESASDVDKFKTSRGTDFARRRNRHIINNNVLLLQKALGKMNYFDGAAAEALRNTGQLTDIMLQDPIIRKSAHAAYIRYLADNVYTIDPGNHILITENNFLVLPIDIPYYVSLTEKFALIK